MIVRVASSVARSVGVEDDGTGGRSAPKVDRREGRHEGLACWFVYGGCVKILSQSE